MKKNPLTIRDQTFPAPSPEGLPDTGTNFPIHTALLNTYIITIKRNKKKQQQVSLEFLTCSPTLIKIQSTKY